MLTIASILQCLEIVSPMGTQVFCMYFIPLWLCTCTGAQWWPRTVLRGHAVGLGQKQNFYNELFLAQQGKKKKPWIKPNLSLHWFLCFHRASSSEMSNKSSPNCDNKGHVIYLCGSCIRP
jgi:hypothetical protein